jgi:ubiquinone/menaquinone biosynthesis C-methylase UbiE
MPFMVRKDPPPASPVLAKPHRAVAGYSTANRSSGREYVVSTVRQQKAYKGWGMEGLIARWYAGNTGKSIQQFKKEAQEIAQRVPSGSTVLEVAPGPGFLAIELAKLGSYRIVGLDTSKSFVRMATENATEAGVGVTFREGNASSMPFESDSFDFVCCRAAFKNISEPVQAHQEMYRVSSRSP